MHCPYCKTAIESPMGPCPHCGRNAVNEALNACADLSDEMQSLQKIQANTRQSLGAMARKLESIRATLRGLAVAAPPSAVLSSAEPPVAHDAPEPAFAFEADTPPAALLEADQQARPDTGQDAWSALRHKLFAQPGYPRPPPGPHAPNGPPRPPRISRPAWARNGSWPWASWSWSSAWAIS